MSLRDWFYLGNRDETYDSKSLYEPPVTYLTDREYAAYSVRREHMMDEIREKERRGELLTISELSVIMKDPEEHLSELKEKHKLLKETRDNMRRYQLMADGVYSSGEK